MLASKSSRAAPSTPPAGRSVSVTSHAEVQSAAAIATAVAAPFTDGPLEVVVGSARTPRTLASCAQYLEAAKARLDSADPVDWGGLLMRGAHCRALAQLGRARAARESFLDGFKLDRKAPGLLPADLHLAVSPQEEKRVREAQAAGRPWKALDPKLTATATRPGELRAKGRGYEVRVWEYGRGDVDGDGIEDLVVRTQGYFTEGSYIDCHVFVLTRTSPNGRITVRQASSAADPL